MEREMINGYEVVAFRDNGHLVDYALSLVFDVEDGTTVYLSEDTRYLIWGDHGDMLPRGSGVYS